MPHSPKTRPSRTMAAAGAVLENVSSLESVAAEHLDRVQGVLRQVLVDQLQFLDEVVGRGDDVAAGLIGLEDVERSADCPKAARRWDRAQQAESLLVSSGRDRGVRDASRVRKRWRRPPLPGVAPTRALRERHHRGHVELDLRARQVGDELGGAFAAGVGDRIFTKTFSPQDATIRLPPHVVEFIREHLEGYRPVLDLAGVYPGRRPGNTMPALRIKVGFVVKPSISGCRTSPASPALSAPSAKSLMRNAG